MSLAKKVTQSVTWMGVTQIAYRPVSLLIMAALARLLTPDDFGLIGLTLIAVGFISIFGEVGLSSAIIQKAELTEEDLSTAFWINVIASLALTLLGIALAYPIAAIYKEPRVAPLLMVMMLSLPISALGHVSNSLLKRRMAFRVIAIIDLSGNIIAGLIAVAMALLGAGVWSLVAQSISLAVILASLRLFFAGGLPSKAISLKNARELSSFSLSVLGCTLVNYLTRNVDNALIGWGLGAKYLGYYTLAYNLMLMPGTSMGGLVGQVMFPALSSLQNDLARFRRGYLRMMRLLSSATIPVVVGLGVTAPLFVKVVYGEQWGLVIPLLQILTVIGIFEATNTFGMVFYAVGAPNLMLKWAIVSLITMTIGFAIGVRWGTLGVAWGYVAVTPVVYVIPHILANHLIGLRPLQFIKSVAPAFFASFVMGLIVLVAKEYQPFAHAWANLIACVALGVLVYMTTIALIGSIFGRQDGLIHWLSGHHLSGSDAHA